MLITYQDSPGAPEDANIRECPYDVEKKADEDIAIENTGLTGVNYHVYPVKYGPAFVTRRSLVRGLH
jgi:hypothetical protein